MNGSILRRLRAIVLHVPKFGKAQPVRRVATAQQLRSKMAGLDLLIQQRKREMSIVSLKKFKSSG